jgi:hypothetical protein
MRERGTGNMASIGMSQASSSIAWLVKKSWTSATRDNGYCVYELRYIAVAHNRVPVDARGEGYFNV